MGFGLLGCRSSQLIDGLPPFASVELEQRYQRHRDRAGGMGPAAGDFRGRGVVGALLGLIEAPHRRERPVPEDRGLKRGMRHD